MLPEVATSNFLLKQPLSALIAREHKRKRRRTWLTGALSLSVALAAGLGYLWLRPHPVPLAARFRSKIVTVGNIVREVSATGHLEAVTTVQVGAEISGRIATVEADYNDRVVAGQVLARFDRAALEAQLAQSRATLALSRAALEQAKTDRERTGRDEERALALFAARSITEEKRDDARAAARLAQQRVVAAEADVAAHLATDQLAHTNLAHTVISSPIDGIVITRNVDSGQTITAMLQTPVLFTVAADLRKMDVIAAVDEADIGEVELGQHASFSVNAFADKVFPAVVTEVRNSPQVVQDVVTYGVKLEVDNFDLKLRPGMTASVHIRTRAVDKVLRAPAAALTFTPPGESPSSSPAVWLLSGTQLQRLAVQAGISDGELTEIRPGALPSGARVLSELTPEGRIAYGIAH